MPAPANITEFLDLDPYDDNDFEEWQQGYEEKEIGTSMPENIAEGTYYWAYTG